MVRRVLIHALVAPVAANVLLLAATFVTTVVTRPGMFDKHVAQAMALLPRLLTIGHCILFLAWALLAVIGMFVADTRRPRSVLGVIRLGLGGAMIGGPGVFIVLIYGLLGVPIWIAICVGTLAICGRISGAPGAGEEASSRGPPALIPDHRAVFGRRGAT
jgi:hypothetical protein